MKKLILLFALGFLSSAVHAGTQNRVTKFSNAAGTKIGNSQILDNGVNVVINSTYTRTNTTRLHVVGGQSIVPSFPAGAEDLTVVFEDNGAASLGIVASSSSAADVSFFKSGEPNAKGYVTYNFGLGALSLGVEELAMVTINTSSASFAGVVESTVGGFKFPDGTTQTTAAASTLVVGSAVTGGGANRVLYEDGSQNLAASANMTYNGTTFTVGQSSMTTVILGSLGSASAPTISFAGDSNTGIYSQASDNLNITVGGVSTLRIQSGAITAPGSIYYETTSSAGSAAAPNYRIGSSNFGGFYGDGMNIGLSLTGISELSMNGSTSTFTSVIVSTQGINIGASAQTITRHLSATASLNFGATAAGTCDLLTMTVTGAVDGNTVSLGIPAALAASDNYQNFTAYVSGADTVTVKRCNLLNTVTALSDPGAATVRVDVWQH